MTPIAEGSAVRRILVLGANGPSGRQTVQQALDRGLAVTALTRHPDAFPITHDRLDLIGGDATDPATMLTAVAGCDAVVSVIGTAYTWKPVEVYSTAARLAVTAMRHHGVRRIVVVTSMGVPRQAEGGGFVQRRLMQLMRSTFTRTLYDDMLEMEHIVTLSALDWTIVRPPGLADAPAAGYAIADARIDAPGMSRADLAAALLDQLTDDRWIGRIAAVATPGLRLDLLETIRKEVLKR